MKRKNINLLEAREISKKFCEDFDIKYCEVYYVDRLGNYTIGEYIWLDPPHMLLSEKYSCKIGLLMHELTHHLDSEEYSIYPLNHSSNGYKNAKKRVINWCRKNISDNANWNLVLKARQLNDEIKKFSL